MANGIRGMSPEERKETLAKARIAITEKRELLERIRAGEIRLSALLGAEYADDRRVQRLHVRTLMMALPGVSAAAVERYMSGHRIPATRRLESLKPAARDELLEYYLRVTELRGQK
jgi:hypothetical protein